MASGEVDRVERQNPVASHSEDNDSAAEALARPTFDVDSRGWTTILFPISKTTFEITVKGKIIHVPPQKHILLVAVNPVRTMPDEWTLRGCTLYISSPGNTNDNDERLEIA
jgi:hypothetical protein